MIAKFKIGDTVKLGPDTVPSHQRILEEEAGIGPYTVMAPAASVFARISVRGASGKVSRNWSGDCFEKVENAPAFKPGDKVRHKDGSTGRGVRTVVRVDRHMVWLSGSIGWFDAQHLELVPEAPAPVATNPGAAVTKTFIVAVLKDGKPAPSASPKTYSSLDQAETVSRIMAEKHIGETFVVFEAVASSVLPRKSALTVRL